MCRAGRSVTGGCGMAPDWGLPSAGRDRQTGPIAIGGRRVVQPADGEGWESARAVADAVLYEGYLLYPYRRSSAKNRVRWQFGVLAPRAWVEARRPVKETVAGSADAWRQRTECLLEAKPACPAAGTAAVPPAAASLGAAKGRRRRVRRGGRARDRRRAPSDLRRSRAEGVRRRGRARRARRARARRAGYPARRGGDRAVGRYGRREAGVASCVRRMPLSARLRLSVADATAPFPLRRLRVIVENTVSDQAVDAPRAEVLRRSLVAAHCVLAVQDGKFLSLLEPPDGRRRPRRSCRNLHTFPVLAGRCGQAGRDAVVPDHHVRPPRRRAGKPR